jgi:hypothetical protein
MDARRPLPNDKHNAPISKKSANQIRKKKNPRPKMLHPALGAEASSPSTAGSPLTPGRMGLAGGSSPATPPVTVEEFQIVSEGFGTFGAPAPAPRASPIPTCCGLCNKSVSEYVPCFYCQKPICHGCDRMMIKTARNDICGCNSDIQLLSTQLDGIRKKARHQWLALGELEQRRPPDVESTAVVRRSFMTRNADTELLLSNPVALYSPRVRKDSFGDGMPPNLLHTSPHFRSYKTEHQLSGDDIQPLLPEATTIGIEHITLVDRSTSAIVVKGATSWDDASPTSKPLIEFARPPPETAAEKREKDEKKPLPSIGFHNATLEKDLRELEYGTDDD